MVWIWICFFHKVWNWIHFVYAVWDRTSSVQTVWIGISFFSTRFEIEFFWSIRSEFKFLLSFHTVWIQIFFGPHVYIWTFLVHTFWIWIFPVNTVRIPLCFGPHGLNLNFFWLTRFESGVIRFIRSENSFLQFTRKKAFWFTLSEHTTIDLHGLTMLNFSPQGLNTKPRPRLRKIFCKQTQQKISNVWIHF